MDSSSQFEPIGNQPMIPEEPVASTWPTVIGVISLIYALGGLLCAVGIAASSFFMERLMKLGGMDVQTPPVIKINGMVSGMLLLGIGVLMLVGAMGVLRRRRSGVKFLKIWSILRVLMLVLGILMTVLTAPAQIQFQRSIYEAQAQKMAEQGRKMSTTPPDDAALWRTTIINVGVFSFFLAVYPVFIGFYLSRRAIAQQVEQWP